MASPTKLPYVPMSVTCPNCEVKQTIHIVAQTGFAQMGDQSIACKKCDEVFNVMVPAKIIDGPFLE
jgi:DNA-directed RNA polymerase subunit M/transcription elongation factor TFIIS